MARKKKLFTYEFSDGEQTIASSYKAKCNITGELIPIYHKFLVKLIKKDYKNNFDLFKTTFAKKEAVQKQKEDAGYGEGDPYKLNAYSEYLVASYRACEKVLEDNFNAEAILKTKKEMDFIKNCFLHRFNRDIDVFLKEK